MNDPKPRNQAPPTIRFSVDELQGVGERRHGMITVLSGAPSDLGSHWVCDRPLVIGRDPDVEVPLGDGSCSRRHAKVDRDPDTGNCVVADLGSTNGTLVNGERIDSRLLKDGDRIVVGATVFRFALTDQVERDYHAKVHELMNFDDLTGLAVKRRFDGEMDRAVTQALGAHGPLAVLMMDLDGLKKINDTHGHHMGAHTISEVGRLIYGVIGTRGTSCRYGGDEFVAFLPGLDKPQAVLVAEEVRKNVMESRYSKDAITVQVTISIGVAALPEDGNTAEDLSKKADEALYRAKGRGRNVVSV